ncbi:MAG: glycosyltransferase family 2 protein [Thermoanaerobaculia bacterium]
MPPARSAGTREEVPFVSVVMPIRNEAPYIATNLADVLAQDYPRDRFEVLVADGMSTDGTREIVESLAAGEPRLRVVENPGRIVASGLNRAIAEARGEVIVRLDGHCEYPGDYLSRIVAVRAATGAANAGGVLVPVGESFVQKSICGAFASRVGIGGAALRAQDAAAGVRDVDAVHGGCWLRETLREAGPFSEEMVRNQDDEMSFRLRRRGGRIVQAPSIRVRYVVRDRWSLLFRQFAQYGYWKVRLVRRYPRQSSLRHLMPAVLVVLLVAGFFASPFSRWAAAGFLIFGSAYLAAIALAALAASLSLATRLWPGVVLALITMHIGYGSGFLAGLATKALPARARAWFSDLSR